MAKKTADIRVMSYNLLHSEWRNAPESVFCENTTRLAKKVFDDFMPSVMGIQEIDEGWHKALTDMFLEEDTYKFACKRHNDGYNMTTLMYNSKEVNLIEEFILDFGENIFIRNLSVGLFETKDNGTKFIVTNAHPAPASRGKSYEDHIDCLIKHTKTVLKKYKGLPLIMTGDFNTREQSKFYNKIMRKIGVKDAKYKAETLVREYSTWSRFGVEPKPGNEFCLDHIFTNKPLKVKRFDVVIDHSVELISDHIPIYADITVYNK